jgi:hypothetical protein
MLPKGVRAMNRLSKKRLVDRLTDAYVNWREVCPQVSDAVGSQASETSPGGTSASRRYKAFVLRPPFLPTRRGRRGTPHRSTQNGVTGKQPRPPAWVRPWLAFKHLTTLGFPRSFPIVQFPNLPLIVAFLASQAGRFVRGSDHSFAMSVSYLAMTIWAYEELAEGVNWFRHLLGLAYVIILVLRVAHALQA